MLAYNHNALKPPLGGHRFRDGTTGETFAEVVRKIAAERVTNHLPFGNPEQEVLAYYQEIAPHLVTNAGGNVANSDRQQVSESIMATAYGRFERLDRNDPVVQRRRDTCAACAHCRCTFEGDETPYSREAERVAVLLSGDLNVMSLGYCTHHRWSVGVASRLKTPETLGLPNPPANCYLPLK